MNNSRYALVPVYDVENGQIKTQFLDDRFDKACLVSESEVATLLGILPGLVPDKISEAYKEEKFFDEPLELAPDAVQIEEFIRLGLKPRHITYITCDAALALVTVSVLSSEFKKQALLFIREIRTRAIKVLLEKNTRKVLEEADAERAKLLAENKRLKDVEFNQLRTLNDGLNPESSCLSYEEVGVIRYMWTKDNVYLRLPRREYHKEVPPEYQ